MHVEPVEIPDVIFRVLEQRLIGRIHSPVGVHQPRAMIVEVFTSVFVQPWGRDNSSQEQATYRSQPRRSES
jgi:hypothetical protein